MKEFFLKILMLMIITPGVFGQQTAEHLTGYWMEQNTASEASLSTLLVFEKDNSGTINGKVYFLESEDFNRSFTLEKIHIEGNTFSFQIKHTSISFYGELNNSGGMCSGTFLMDGDTSFEVNHQKLTGKKLERVIGLPETKRRTIRRHVDADDGLLIS